jgi:hypothetical protein
MASVPREVFIAITRGMLLLCERNQRNSTIESNYEEHERRLPIR